MNTGSPAQGAPASRTTVITSSGSVLTVVTADPSVETGIGLPGSESSPNSGPEITGTGNKGSHSGIPTSGGSSPTPTDGSGHIIVEVNGHGLSDGAQKAIIAVSTICKCSRNNVVRTGLTRQQQSALL